MDRLLSVETTLTPRREREWKIVIYGESPRLFYRERGDRLLSVETTLTQQGERGQTPVGRNHVDCTQRGDRLMSVEATVTLQEERGQRSH